MLVLLEGVFGVFTDELVLAGKHFILLALLGGSDSKLIFLAVAILGCEVRSVLVLISVGGLVFIQTHLSLLIVLDRCLILRLMLGLDNWGSILSLEVWLIVGLIVWLIARLVVWLIVRMIVWLIVRMNSNVVPLIWRVVLGLSRILIGHSGIIDLYFQVPSSPHDLDPLDDSKGNSSRDNGQNDPQPNKIRGTRAAIRKLGVISGIATAIRTGVGVAAAVTGGAVNAAEHV